MNYLKIQFCVGYTCVSGLDWDCTNWSLMTFIGASCQLGTCMKSFTYRFPAQSPVQPHDGLAPLDTSKTETQRSYTNCPRSQGWDLNSLLLTPKPLILTLCLLPTMWHGWFIPLRNIYWVAKHMPVTILSDKNTAVKEEDPAFILGCVCMNLMKQRVTGARICFEQLDSLVSVSLEPHFHPDHSVYPPSAFGSALFPAWHLDFSVLPSGWAHYFASHPSAPNLVPHLCPAHLAWPQGSAVFDLVLGGSPSFPDPYPFPATVPEGGVT